jgi:hypothetical protein
MKSLANALVYVGFLAIAAWTPTSTFGDTVSLQLVIDPAVPGCDGCTLSGPNTWNLIARANDGDNFGILSYLVSVQNVTSILHRSPFIPAVVNPSDDTYRVGFSLLRSADNTLPTGTGFLVRAVQDVFTGSPVVIRGFGQTSGSFAALVPPEDTYTVATQPTWNSALLLAEGSYATGANPFVDLFENENSVNVFSGPTGEAFESAEWTLHVPEPSTLVLFALGCAASGFRRRAGC